MFVRQQLFIVTVSVIFSLLAGWMYLAGQPYFSTAALALSFASVVIVRAIVRKLSEEGTSPFQDRRWNASVNRSVEGKR